MLSENLGFWKRGRCFMVILFFVLVEVAVLDVMSRNATCLVGLQIHTY